jgi:hypothetical protein
LSRYATIFGLMVSNSVEGDASPVTLAAGAALAARHAAPDQAVGGGSEF